MKIEKLIVKNGFIKNLKLEKAIKKMENLIKELTKKEIPLEIIGEINSDIKKLNTFSGTDKELLKILKKSYCKILNILEKKLKIVPKDHYRNLWLAIGISIFGVVFGSVLSTSLNDYSFIGIGIPIGMAIGIAVGTNLDKKAAEEGKQLDVCPRY